MLLDIEKITFEIYSYYILFIHRHLNFYQSVINKPDIKKILPLLHHRRKSTVGLIRVSDDATKINKVVYLYVVGIECFFYI